MHLCNWSILQLHNLCVFSYSGMCCVYIYVCVLCVYVCVGMCACVYIHVDVGVYMCTCACVLCVCEHMWVWGVACCKADWCKAHKGHFAYLYIYTIYIYCILYIKSILHNILCTHMHTYVIVMETSLCYTLESMQVYLTCNVNSNFHKINILRMDIWTC